MQAAESIFLFGGHLGFGFGRLVGLPCEMQQAVDNDAMQFVKKWCAHLFGVAGYRVQRNINIAVHTRARGIIKGDDIRIIVVLQELTVYCQNLLVVAEYIIEVAHRITVLGCSALNPLLDFADVNGRHGDIVSVEGDHFWCLVFSERSRGELLFSV